ncbi:hypothetical protein GCM10010975_15830 [Comamonas phosphati]|nr:hypothetical protein GCM10010975_15830 [Comamonas phosphati]
MHMFDLRSLRVLKDGRLVFERYSNGLTRGHNHELYPVTKTITALTFGVPEGQGKISIGDRAAAWIVKAHPEFKARLADKQEIRLGSLMAMSSGRLCQPVEGSAPQNLHATRASSEHRPTPQTPRNSDIQHEIPRI